MDSLARDLAKRIFRRLDHADCRIIIEKGTELWREDVESLEWDPQVGARPATDAVLAELNRLVSRRYTWKVRLDGGSSKTIVAADKYAAVRLANAWVISETLSTCADEDREGGWDQAFWLVAPYDTVIERGRDGVEREVPNEEHRTVTIPEPGGVAFPDD